MLLVAIVLASAALGHWTRVDGGRAQLAQTTGGSNSGGGDSGSGNNSGSSGNSGNSGNNDGSSGSSDDNGSSGTSDNDGSSGGSEGSGGGGGGTGGTTPGGGTTPSGGTAPPGGTTPGGGTRPVPQTAPPSIPPDRVDQAKPASCPDDVQAGAQCFRIRPTDDPAGARLPDGRVVVLPPGPNINVDTGASTSNDIDQVIVVNNDNRVISRESLNSRVRQWMLATVGLLMLVLVAAGVGAAIFRAGMRQGRESK